MNKITANYKYNVGDIVYGMYENNIKRFIIASISISLNTNTIKTYLTEKIISKLIKIFSEEYPFKQSISYSVDMVTSDGKFEASVRPYMEYELFSTKEDLLKSLWEKTF